VEIDENVENGLEHVTSFRGSEGALRENLREILLSELRHNVEKIRISEAAAAEVQEAKQIGMGK
jgi:hypothetical protein